ncbi:PDDEXK-like family protein [Flavobacterium sp. GNP002]
MDKIKTLLQQVSSIRREYEKAKITEENFNVFSVMNMEHSEVNTHSSIIGELLNPNGSHGQGDVFLKFFISEVQNSFGSDIELNNFDTLINDKICEKTVSLDIDWENITGGRIDLILEDKNQILIIENKLYAIDQPLQLIRYDNYAKTKKKEYKILYLTLFGKKIEKEEKLNGIIRGYNFIHTEISEYKLFSENNKNNNCLYYPISFEFHIRNWIKKCLENRELKPLLKSTLQQYLALIEKITFQTMSEKMKKKIVSTILENPEENIKSAFEIHTTIYNLKRELYNTFIDNLKNKIGFKEIEGANNIDIVDINNDAEYCGVYLNFTVIKKNTIGVFFGRKNDNSPFSENVFFGFRKKEGLEDLIEKIENKYNFLSTPFWIYKNSEFNNWGDSPEIWEDVAKGKEGKVYQEIISVIKEIIEIEKISN